MTTINSDMSSRGKIGGYARSAKYGPEELTGAARRGFMDRFTPTDSGLSEEERRRRALAGLKAHMAQLARKSAIARGKTRERHDEGRKVSLGNKGPEEA
jgi:hypothetical protein